MLNDQLLLFSLLNNNLYCLYFKTMIFLIKLTKNQQNIYFKSVLLYK
jgi:hypothetical protein